MTRDQQNACIQKSAWSNAYLMSNRTSPVCTYIFISPSFLSPRFNPTWWPDTACLLHSGKMEKNWRWHEPPFYRYRRKTGEGSFIPPPPPPPDSIVRVRCKFRNNSRSGLSYMWSHNELSRRVISACLTAVWCTDTERKTEYSISRNSRRGQTEPPPPGSPLRPGRHELKRSVNMVTNYMTSKDGQLVVHYWARRVLNLNKDRQSLHSCIV